MKSAFALALAGLLQFSSASAFAQEGSFARYKPSSRSPEAIDIRSNSYGASRLAPTALKIGEQAPGFQLPLASGGSVSLQQLRQQGPVAIIFYRGHW